MISGPSPTRLSSRASSSSQPIGTRVAHGRAAGERGCAHQCGPEVDGRGRCRARAHGARDERLERRPVSSSLAMKPAPPHLRARTLTSSGLRLETRTTVVCGAIRSATSKPLMSGRPMSSSTTSARGARPSSGHRRRRRPRRRRRSRSSSSSARAEAGTGVVIDDHEGAHSSIIHSRASPHRRKPRDQRPRIAPMCGGAPDLASVASVPRHSRLGRRHDTEVPTCSQATAHAQRSRGGDPDRGGFGVSGDAPSTGDSAASIKAFYVDHSSGQQLGAFILMIAAPFLIVFAAALRSTLVRCRPRHALALGQRPLAGATCRQCGLPARGRPAAHSRRLAGAPERLRGAGANALSSETWPAFTGGIGVMLLGAAGGMIPLRSGLRWLGWPRSCSAS